jgi:DNA-nicking Smr family endonuclease
MRINISLRSAKSDTARSFPHHTVKRFLSEQKDQAENSALFRAAVGEVKSLPDQNRIKPQKPPHKPLLRPLATPPAIPDTLSDFAAENAPDEFLRNGLSRISLRKLRHGNWPVQDSLDLHGNNSDAARKLLQEFLYEAAQHGLRCVLVIHGKGMNSRDGEAVLRKLTRHWLAQRPDVLAYCDALPKDGGSGAALVLLKVIVPPIK